MYTVAAPAGVATLPVERLTYIPGIMRLLNKSYPVTACFRCSLVGTARMWSSSRVRYDAETITSSSDLVLIVSISSELAENAHKDVNKKINVNVIFVIQIQ